MQKLFDELERTLSATWDCMYKEAEKYYLENGNLLLPQAFVTEDGYKLGQWIVTQRINRSKNDPSLTQSRIARLDEIGMQWRSIRDRNWEEKYSLAQECFSKNGHLDIPAEYVTENGVQLGRWYRTVKDSYRLGRLSEEKQRQLEAIGMNWDSVKDRTWSFFFDLARDYYRKHGDLNVNAKYETEDGTKLGVWISSQRYSYNNGNLSNDRIAMLEDIGMLWQRDVSRWDDGFLHAIRYAEKADINGVKASYCSPDSYKLGEWLRGQKRQFLKGKLDSERQSRLENIGMFFSD